MRSGTHGSVNSVLSGPNMKYLKYAIATCRSLRDGAAEYAHLSGYDRRDMFLLELQWVREYSRQDFGEDVEAYQAWYDQHKDDWKKYSNRRPRADGSHVG